MAEVGPDGNVWVIDWYNYIVQHNPTPPGFKTGKGNAYESDLRDKKHGRIYRLVAKNAKATAPFTLKDAPVEKLVATLAHDNLFWRRHAQRLLVERGQKDVAPALFKLASDPTVDAIGLNAGVIHALWTLHGLGILDGSQPEATKVAVTALRHKSAGVRRNALLVLPRHENSSKAILASGVLDDGDAQVRLAAMLALAEMPAYAQAGAAIGAFAGLSAATLVPGLGPIVGMGMLASGLIGTALGAAAGKVVDRHTHGVPNEDLYFFDEALRHGQTVVIVDPRDPVQETKARNLLERAGGRSTHSLRQEWWQTIRDRHRHEFNGDEEEYRAGFEAALHPFTRGRDLQEVAPYVETCYPEPCRSEAFRIGFQRGQEYFRNRMQARESE